MPRVLSPAAQARLAELPGWAQGAPEHQALCQVAGKEGERQRALAAEVRDGLIPIHANAITLPLWETLLKLTVNPVGATVEERRNLVIARLLAVPPDPSGATWEQQVEALLGPGWSYEEEEGEEPTELTIRVKVPFAEGTSEFMQAKRILEIKRPAAWELIVESGEQFILDQSKLDEQQFHAS